MSLQSLGVGCWLRLTVAVVVAQSAVPSPGLRANEPQTMQPYTIEIPNSEAKIRMLPIPGGTFTMGSPATEPNRNADEGPLHEVKIEPFYMSECEITWNAYDTWGEGTDKLLREALGLPSTEQDAIADAVTKPTEPYTDMSFGMGRGEMPAICMTQHAARKFCEWLTARTGEYHRLPTEAEWEYACRAGTTTAYSFGDDPAQLGEYAWYDANSDGTYHEVGQKLPNPWGLKDMHGNVAEWVLDQYVPEIYASRTDGVAVEPLAIPTTLYPRVVRGGGWDDPASMCRSAVREGSSDDWKIQDPQLPKSIWYHTDALGVGFRVVRPLRRPTAEERAAKWDKTEPEQLDPIE
ncbi:MAG: formylglycine-generating enzyme family protein [Planctomycetaceae bacterium]